MISDDDEMSGVFRATPAEGRGVEGAGDQAAQPIEQVHPSRSSPANMSARLMLAAAGRSAAARLA